MKHVWKRIKRLLRKKPATIAANVSLLLSSLTTLGILDLAPDKAAAISSLVVLGTTVLANVIFPTEPKTVYDEDKALTLQEDL